MKTTELTKTLRQKSIDELKAELLSLLREQFNLRIQKATGQLSRTHSLGQVRHNIARIKTILNENRSKVSEHE